MYTEETKLNYGSYKGKMIKDLPEQYILNVFRSGGNEHLLLREYIVANMSKYPRIIPYRYPSEPVAFICNKRTFPSKKAAMESIVKSTSKPKKPVPIRAYECPECSGWHLTSKPDKRFEKQSPE